MWKNRACVVLTTQPSNHGLDGGMESGKYRLRNGKIFFLQRWIFFLKRIGIKLQQYESQSLEEKVNGLMNLKIFLHEKGKFHFYSRYLFVFLTHKVLQNLVCLL